MWIECAKLARFRWLLHAFSTRLGGPSAAPAAGLNLGFTGWDRAANVEENRRRLLRALEAEDFPLATVHQVHSASAYRVLKKPGEGLQYRSLPSPAARQTSATERVGDALLTNEGCILLSVRSADCMPVLLVDPRERAVATVHAGWRGALAGIIKRTVLEMTSAFGSHPADLIAAVGPFIHACCYEVGADVVEAFQDRFRNTEEFFQKSPTGRKSAGAAARTPHDAVSAAGSSGAATAQLELGAVARHELPAAGVRESNILVTELCTACRTDLFFSHRKEGDRTGRMMAVIGIRPADTGDRAT